MKKKSRNTYNKQKQGRKLKMKGGIIKQNPDLSSWQAVYNMIKSKHSTLSAISYNSLVGFVFKLDVAKEYSEFLGLNNARTSFNEPVKSLIFKIVIIHDDSDIPVSKKRKNNKLNDIDDEDDEDHDNNKKIRIAIPKYQDKHKKIHSKGLENKENFIQEAVIQQDIYLKTINPNGNYICPSIIDLSLFKNDDSKQLIDDLLKTSIEDYECSQMLNYLKNILKYPNFELGMITMELVDNNYTPSYNIYKNDIYTTNCEYALAEIIILFIKLKLVNYDCHSGNVLANRSGDSKSLLIDFGRVIDLKNVPENIKQQYESFTGTNFDDDFDDVNDIDVTNFYNITRETYKQYSEHVGNIIRIVRLIAFIDFSTNYTKYNFPPDHPLTEPQMNDLIRFLYGHKLNIQNIKDFNWYNLKSDTILSVISICNKIEELTIGRVTQKSIFSDNAMKSKISNKKFFDNNIDVNSLYRENRPSISEGNCDPNDETCWTRTLKRVGNLFGITRKRSRSTSPQRNSSSSKTRKRKQKEE